MAALREGGTGTGPTGGQNRSSPRTAVAVGITWGVAALLIVLLLLGPLVPQKLPGLPSSPGGAPPSQPSTAPPGSGSPANQSSGIAPQCNAVGIPTPSAVLIPLPNPSANVSAGARLTVEFEFEALNYSAALAGASVDFPSVFATFPTSSGPQVTVYFPPAQGDVASAGWPAQAFASRTVALPASAVFAAASAQLSTQKIAVMASEPYGALSLAVRWHWIVTDAGGAQTVGAWSQPTAQANWPTATPSIFFPAPFVQVVGSTPNPAVIGTEYTAWLAGFVAGASFYLELENPSTGSVYQSQSGVAPDNGSAPYASQILLLNYDDYLYPGSYLVHLHDECGALLYSFSVQAAYAAQATVSFSVSPTSCGPVLFNGSAYASGSRATVTPSETPVSFSIGSCAGFSFASWTTSGGLHVTNDTSLLVSSSGAFTVQYQ